MPKAKSLWLRQQLLKKKDFILYGTGDGYWICNKSGGDKRKIQLPFDHHNVGNMQILADGNSVVFNYLEFPVYSVYTMNFDGSNLVKILGGLQPSYVEGADQQQLFLNKTYRD